jgi:hypothetical protein
MSRWYTSWVPFLDQWDRSPETDGGLQKVVRDKIRHYRQIHLNRPDPIAPVVVDTTGRVYDDFNRLLFLHAQS